MCHEKSFKLGVWVISPAYSFDWVWFVNDCVHVKGGWGGEVGWEWWVIYEGVANTFHVAILPHIATRCNTLQHVVTHCDTLGICESGSHVWHAHIAPHCSTLQHTAIHCNTLQHIAAHRHTLGIWESSCHGWHARTASHHNTLQHIATHCNTL